MKISGWLGLSGALAVAACGDDGDEQGRFTQGMDGGLLDAMVVGSQDGGFDGAASSSCAALGGADDLERALRVDVISAIRADCRIGAQLTSLSASELARVEDCLTFQALSLAGCPGAYYGPTSRAYNGLACIRGDADGGLGISSEQAAALREDVRQGLRAAGVEGSAVEALASALSGPESALVNGWNATRGASCGADAGERLAR